MKRKFTTIALLLAVILPGAAQKRNSVALITDSKSWSQCNTAIENYRKSIIQDGLDAFIAAGSWDTPEQVRDSLKKWKTDKQIEGAVFIGDIPIPMIQKAQHLTSAFKMDELRYPRRDSSVPSDRFYDDFDLEFRFIGRDSLQHNLFYYDLSPFSPQEISCDIYTARIKPSSMFGNCYEELSAYLNKVVRLKAEQNILDEVSSHTGDGSFSNSLVAWKDESITLAEQLPEAFNSRKEGKFLLYAMDPDIKQLIFKEIQRPDLDLILFHEHGLTQTQYISGNPPSDQVDKYFEMGRYGVRNYIRSQINYGKTQQEAESCLKNLLPDIREEWYKDALDSILIQADSLIDNKSVIELDEIQKVAPNVKMAIFDACYNGDFRESDWVANRYIMSPGECVVTIGNSVNVLQDKSSSDLLGMLAAGHRVGEWMKETNILESHIFGDPTWRFQTSYKEPAHDLENKNIDYWLDILENKKNCYSGSLALHKLYQLKYEGLSDLLLDTYRTSPYYMVRLQCLHLSAHYSGDNYITLLKEAADDPYEFIRRKALFFMGKNGSEELVENLTNAYMNDWNSKRIAFNIGFSASHFSDSLFIKSLRKKTYKSDMVIDKDAFMKMAEKYYKGPCSMSKSTLKILSDKEAKTSSKQLYLMGMRNNPYPFMTDRIIDIILDNSQPIQFRIDAASVLGWFVRAWNKEDLVETLRSILSGNINATTKQELPLVLQEEISKTIKRLEVFCR